VAALPPWDPPPCLSTPQTDGYNYFTRSSLLQSTKTAQIPAYSFGVFARHRSVASSRLPLSSPLSHSRCVHKRKRDARRKWGCVNGVLGLSPCHPTVLQTLAIACCQYLYTYVLPIPSTCSSDRRHHCLLTFLALFLGAHFLHQCNRYWREKRILIF
jgi:hypothetical protein